MANTGLLLLFFGGVILVIVNELVKDRVPEVEYRYLPRDLDTYLREEPRATVTYESMFRGDERFAKRFPDTRELTEDIQDEATWRKYYEMRRSRRLPTAADMKDITAWYKRLLKEYRERGPGSPVPVYARVPEKKNA